MPVESIGSPTIVPPAQSSTESSTVPTNAGVFQFELAADSVAEQVQQVQEASAQPEATGEQQQTNQQTQEDNSQSDQVSAPREEATSQQSSPTPGEGRGENVNIEV